MGVGSAGDRRRAPWIFIHDTDKVEKGLMVRYFSVLFVSLTPPPENFFAFALDDVFLYFSFIEYRFVSTFSLSISNPAYFTSWPTKRKFPAGRREPMERQRPRNITVTVGDRMLLPKSNQLCPNLNTFAQIFYFAEIQPNLP